MVAEHRPGLDSCRANSILSMVFGQSWRRRRRLVLSRVWYCVLVVAFALSSPAPWAQKVIVEVPDFGEEDEPVQMSLPEIAAVFPSAGPFAFGSGPGRGDRFISEALDGVNPDLIKALLPVVQSRWPNAQQHPCLADISKFCRQSRTPLHCLGLNSMHLSQACHNEVRHTVPYVCSGEIHELCDDDLETGALPCLERHGSQLGISCADAIVAASHALAGIAAVQQAKAKAKRSHDDGKHHRRPQNGRHNNHRDNRNHEDAHKGSCPVGWSGPEKDGCCSRRWQPDCGTQCAAELCGKAGHVFEWLDFRKHPYSCCPPARNDSTKYIGGQSLCPYDWYLENKELCCRRGWAWTCGQHCAETQCREAPGMMWVPVDAKKEHYKCCASGHLPLAEPGAFPMRSSLVTGATNRVSPGVSVANMVSSLVPDGNSDSVDNSWFGKVSGWSKCALAVGLLASVFAARRLMGTSDQFTKQL